jgi:phosphate starvation-inducible PhoH-like protein
LSERERLILEDPATMQLVVGSSSALARVAAEIEKGTGVRVHVRGTEVTLEGDDQTQVKLVNRFLAQLARQARSGEPIDPHDAMRALEVLKSNPETELRDIYSDFVLPKSQGNRGVAPRSLAQKRYVEALRTHSLTFGIGPAGTGKTFLAVAMAVRRFLDKDVRRIILTRPAIEAGENLGFLPGTLEEKISPYMRPLYDALFEMLGNARTQKLLEDGTIEIAPLAYMRGRTLNDAYVILDEAQNTTREQMKMFLTRIGQSTWATITGDPTQIDLGNGEPSGLAHAISVLRKVRSIAFCRFSDVDVMRHPLVQEIVRAYEEERVARQRKHEEERFLRQNGDAAKGAAVANGLVVAKPAQSV